MSDNKTLQPHLRFLKFRDTEPWEELTIGDIGNFYYGKSAPKWSLEKNAPTPCVRYGELYTRFGATITETYSRTNIDPEKLRFSKGGEVLVPRVGERPEDFGKCCSYLPLGNVAIGEMISVFETAQNPLFYTYYFRNLYAQFAKVVEGQNVKNLYYAQLEPLKIGRPTLPEQQKIADCLTSLDDLITAQGQKVTALERHKKGLMQQLFPATGQSSPILRFPEFRDAGPWEEKRLGDFCEALSGCPVSGDDIWEKNTGLRLLRGINITEGHIRHSTNIDRYHGGSVSSGEKFLLKKDDVVIGMDGSKVGKNAATITECDAGSFLIQRVTRLRENSKNSLQYVYFHIISDKFRRYVDTVNTSSGIPHISLKQINDFEISMPHPEEQQKIAACLTSLESLITAHAQKLDALKAHKKGLMQQLFPTSDEGAP